MQALFSRIRQIAIHPALWCAIAVAVCVLAARPSLEMGFGDDFSYIWTAREMANTGHMVYNGWATAMLGWQIYLGALFIKVFGFSFTVVRASILLVGMATTALLQRLFVRMGVNTWNATLATLTLTLSPLFLPLTFSFMTDVPGLFAILVCLYGCIRAIQTKSDSAAIRWLLFAALANAIGGTVRQIAWLGVLVMVPSAAWVMRRRHGVWPVSVVVWILSTGFIASCIYWFKKQPYSVSEPLVVHVHFVSHTYLAILLFLLPILIAFVARYPIRERWARTQAVAVILAMVVVGGLCYTLWPGELKMASGILLAPFSDGEVTAKGIEAGRSLGTRPDVLPMWVRFILTLLTFSAVAAFTLCLLNASRLKKCKDAGDDENITHQELHRLLLPFAAAYLALTVTRAAVFERYFLPLLFLALVFALRFYQAKIAPRLPVLSVAFIALFAVYGVVAFHDLLATDRARLEAADHLRAAGIPRSDFRVGAEYDGWTQIELTGSLAPKKRRLSLPRCDSWWESDDPAIHARYQLSYDLACFPKSHFTPVDYATWLPPNHQKIYILDVSK